MIQDLITAWPMLAVFLLVMSAAAGIAWAFERNNR